MAAGLLFVLTSSAVAQSNKELRARALFEGGAKRYKAGDLKGALELWREAYRILPRAKILLNVARLEQKLGHDVAAANGFAAYLKRDDADPNATAAVRNELAKLDARLARLVIDARGTGDVFVGERTVGAAPATIVVRVKPGTHSLRLGTATPVSVEAKPGGRTQVTLEPPAAQPKRNTRTRVTKPLPSAGPGDRVDRPIYKRAWLYTGLVTAGAAAAGIVFGLQSKAAVEDVDRLNSTSSMHNFSDAQALVDRAESRATLANISFIAAGVAGGITLYLMVRGGGQSPQSAAALAPTAGGAVATYRLRF